ncbi:transmembrane protein [Perilla frutescens var. hirtella]|uniref:Transmembrane protein n=1 Tax=Perilla frutescens var. hirtella TaxID=608512 RepID=A0AAD4P2H5_PERFH|nr:transmembrane protein [Perilla frutescens var. frutescens]KAH6823677.1 transmembrane protein [Perilla frutescens var. hirtella]
MGMICPSAIFLLTYSDDLSTSNNGTKAEHPRGSSTGSKIIVLGLVLVAAALISFFVFKFWQRKKREEQYARLLKLFEEDDDLELELGLRD